MDLQIGRAWSILMQTKPYLAYRAAVYGALALAGLVYVAFLGLVGAVFGGGAAVVLLIVSLVGGSMLGLGRLVGEYVLYVLKAGHVALVTELIEKGALPAGIEQTTWAKQRVMALVKEVSVLALLDQLVRGVIRFAHRRIFNLSGALPIPGIQDAAKGAGRIVELSVTFVDEAMLAHAFRTGSDNVFEASKSGIVLYCQSWKEILKNAVALAVIGYVVAGLLFVVLAVPFGLVALAVPAKWAGVRFTLFLAALVLAGAIKLIVYNPLACTATILTFFSASRGQQPSAEWMARLDEASDAFRQLGQQASAFVARSSEAAAPASSVASDPPAAE